MKESYSLEVERDVGRVGAGKTKGDEEDGARGESHGRDTQWHWEMKEQGRVEETNDDVALGDRRLVTGDSHVRGAA